MQYQKSMFFFQQENGHKRVIAEPYDDDCSFYAYLREKRDMGMSPITVTARQIAEFYEQYDGTIFKIEFAQEDEQVYPGDLLPILDEELSMYVSRVYFRFNNQDAVVYWQTNGIVGINAASSKDLLEGMCEFLERTV